MKVKVLGIHFSKRSRQLQAFADIEILNGWIIRGFRIVDHNSHGFSVEPPMSFWKNFETGLIERKPIIIIPSIERQEIKEAILSAYRREIGESHGEEPKEKHI